MNTLPDKLRIQAGVMEMGETIAWGSDTALMYQAADEIQRLEAENAEMRELLMFAADNDLYSHKNYWAWVKKEKGE